MLLKQIMMSTERKENINTSQSYCSISSCQTFFLNSQLIRLWGETMSKVEQVKELFSYDNTSFNSDWSNVDR